MVVNNQNSNNVHNRIHDIINPIFLIDIFFILAYCIDTIIFQKMRRAINMLKFKQILFHN